jgi:hypothetical protein
VLELCRAAHEEPEAALATQRWEEWQRLRPRASGRGERRFRRRAYERARENALAVLLMRAQAARGAPRRGPQTSARMRRGTPVPGQPTTRLRVLLRQYGGRR